MTIHSLARPTITFLIVCFKLFPFFSCTANRPFTAYVEVAHGGHLGFYEGGLLYPNPVTWLDRCLVSMVGSIVNMKVDAAIDM